jgi:D-alanyl-D-alanine carboxypeptidase
MAAASKISLSLSVLFLWSACASAPAPAPAAIVPAPVVQAPQPLETPTTALAATIDRITAAPPLQRAIWGIYVEDDAGRVLYTRNAQTLMIPASNRKLFNAAAVVNCLGFDARLSTEIWRDGADLIVRGGADPSLGSWRYGREDDFANLAADLQRRGITSLRDVIADVSRFDRVTIPGAWKFGNLGSDYSAPVDALAWGENEIPVDRAVSDPAQYTAETLRAALIAQGITVRGIARVNTEPRTWRERITELPSPFLSHLLMAALKNSHNLYAEMLLKNLAASAAPASYGAAFDIERRFLNGEVHIANDEFRFVDGSGLAPDDLVTPAATVRLLRWMNDPARRGMWWTILAAPNQEGTLRRRLIPLEQRLRAKTGTVAGVNALSGIVRGEHGGYRYFTIVVNHHLADDSVSAIDAIASEIARF